MTERHGWFADIDTDTAITDDCRWQPCLQVTALCLPFPVWFPTEAACLDFIEKEIIGQGVLTADNRGLSAVKP